MQTLKLLCTNFIEDESGQDLIEYALLTALVALAAAAVIKPIGTAIVNVFTAITTQLQNALPA